MSRPADTYLPWLILRALPCIGSRQLKQLIETFITPDAVLNAKGPALAAVSGMTPKKIRAVQDHARVTGQAARLLDQILQKGYQIMTWSDPDYPPLLREIPDPPMVFIYDGRLDRDAPCFSIVGSRQATRYGQETAAHLAGALASRGFTIVSGLAAGIDTAAHNGALSAGGKTIAVLGSGLNKIYPARNKGLGANISQNGALISEFDPDAPPLGRHFPVRNRIIAGLSCGTLVVEAAQKSGSLITARLAGEFNREVFAVPGSVKSARSRGTHQLIRQGARLVETEMDILDELHQFVHPVPATKGPAPQQDKKTDRVDKDQALVYNHLDLYPRHIDQIIEAAGLKSHRVAAILTEMELAGTVYRHPGNLFSLSEE